MITKLYAIFVLLLSFHSIFNEPIEIQNGEEFIMTEGIYEYEFSYQFKEPHLIEGKAPYFYFYFSEDAGLTIIDEDRSKKTISFKRNSYFEGFEIKNLKSQKYTFKVEQKYSSYLYNIQLMIFIDSSRDIIINYDKLFNLGFKTDSIYGTHPVPLTFKANTIKEKIIFSLKPNDGEYLLEFCEIGENSTCVFNRPSSNLFTLEKGKDYKFQLNCTIYNSYYIFKKLEINYLIKEVEIGPKFFEISNSSPEHYFIIDMKKYETLYLYAKCNDDFNTTFISEEEKNVFIDNIDKFSYSKNNKNKLITVNKANDYLIIKFQYNAKNYKGYFYIAQLYYSLKDSQIFQLRGDIYTILVYPPDTNNYSCLTIISSKHNLNLIDDSFSLESFDNLKNQLVIESSSGKDFLIYAYYPKEDSILNININLCNYNFDLLDDYKLTNSFFNNYSSDYIYMRTSTQNIQYGFNTKYFLNMNESYYLYIKKYYGNIDIYRYNKELSIYSNITGFCPPIQILVDTNEYSIINNKLLIISGNQLFTLFNYDMSIYDFYIQKINDSPYIKLNSKIHQFNNTVRLIKEDKIYYVDFNLDHLIKLDENFDATVKFTDSHGTQYILNSTNRIIRDLKGENVTIKTNKIALLYFYKKIPDNYEIGTIIFDKSQKSKHMKFNMKNINGKPIKLNIIKDFCFEGYFPMLRNKNWENVDTNINNSTTIFIDNLYEKLETELLEDEKYIIYFFESIDANNYPIFNSKAYEIGEPTYFENLFSGNKYNFGIIPPNSIGSIFLNTLNFKDIQFQFIFCKNEYISGKIEHSNGYNNDLYTQQKYPYSFSINREGELRYYNDKMINSILSFSSNYEFIFGYSYHTLVYNIFIEYKEIRTILQKIKNIVEITFPPAGSKGLIKYVIIIKKDENINIDSDLDICSIFKLFTQNNSSDSIIIKELVKFGGQKTNEVYSVNISSLNTDPNTKLICSIFAFDIDGNSIYSFYNPLKVKIEDITPVEISLDEVVTVDIEKRNFFKFNYQLEETNSKNIFLIFSKNVKFSYSLYVHFMDDTNSKELQLYLMTQLFLYTNFTLSKSGTYYLKFDNFNEDFTFYSFIPGKLIDTIDFSKNKYSKIHFFQLTYKLEPNKYKVVNLSKDIWAYFIFEIETNYRGYPIPFKICNDNTNKCTENIVYYKFLKNYNYTIYINFVTHDNSYYYYPSYCFYSIPNNYIEQIKKGYFTVTEPKMYIIDLRNQGNLILLYKDIFTSYVSRSNEIVTLEKINTLKFEIIYQDYLFNERYGYKYGIIINSRPYNKNITDMVIFNQYLSTTDSNEYTLKANTNAYGLLDYYYSHDYPLYFYNILTTISSPINSLKYIASPHSIEYYNYIIQNYYPIPVYIDEYKEDYNISIKIYLPRYAFIIGNHNDLLHIFNSYITRYESSYEYNLDEYLPLNLRINSDLNDFYEFLNIYLYEIKDKINIYIKKYYGQSELFECNPDFIDKNDLTVITKPITTCKNKNSLFDKIYSLEGTDFISGYIGYNSYFDIYIELDNDDKNIKISTLMKNYKLSNAAKYLKKNIEYNINFKVDHLIKIIPNFNAEVIIYNNEGLYIKLNSSNPTSKVKGENLKIKSNNDTMVYFYSKLLDGIKQFKIENIKGKNIEIKIYKYSSYIIDFGFEGYNPSDILSLEKDNFEKAKGTIYIENIYDKLKTNLVSGEYLYIYYCSSSDLKDPEINYNSININNPDNDYNFILIDKNDINNNEEKSLIINNNNKEEIQYQVYFCTDPHLIEMLYQNLLTNYKLEFNEEETIIRHEIDKGPIKLQFNSAQDFIFIYSFIDKTDIAINNYYKWIYERNELDNLSIKGVYNNISSILIEFYSNYKYSSTKYIIVITPLDDKYDITNLSNPCYIIKQVTEKNKNINIINYVDIGEADLISVKVDISDLLPSKSDKYLINIISQELRFSKKINFYKPYIFNLKDDIDLDIDIYLDEIQTFNLSDNEIKYKLSYTKISQKMKYFCLIINLTI